MCKSAIYIVLWVIHNYTYYCGYKLLCLLTLRMARETTKKINMHIQGGSPEVLVFANVILHSSQQKHNVLQVSFTLAADKTQHT